MKLRDVKVGQRVNVLGRTEEVIGTVHGLCKDGRTTLVQINWDGYKYTETVHPANVFIVEQE